MSTDCRRVGRRRRQSGFILLEALIALGILGFTLVLVNSSVTSGWRARQRLELEANALAIARSRLTEAGVVSSLREGVETGFEGGYAWRLEIVRHAAPHEASVRSPLPAWWVNVQVTWPDNSGSPQRTVELLTIKIGGAAQ